MSIYHFRVPAEAARREYAVYLILARHKATRETRYYIGKTGDNRVGCNPLISRAGNHFSFNPIHSQSRNHLGNPEEYDFDFFFTTFGAYVHPSESRDGIDLINEMERQLNFLSQKEFQGMVINPLGGNHVWGEKKRYRQSLVTEERLAKLKRLVATVKRFVDNGETCPAS